MGRHGENIRKRSDGRWEARCIIYDTGKGKKVLKSAYGHTYEEAKQKRLLLLNQSRFAYAETEEGRKKPEQQMYQNLLFRAVAEEWMETVKRRQKASTHMKYSAVYHMYLEEPLGGIALGNITGFVVKEKIFDPLSNNRQSDISDSLQKSIYCVLNQILKYASTQYSISFPHIHKPVSGTCKNTIKVFTKSEQIKLFSAVYHQMNLFKMAVLLCLFTGLRLGELCTLKWSDIDFENKTLSVKRTVQRLYVEGCRTKTALVETEPKSEHARREIPLQDTVIKLLANFENNKNYIFGGGKPLDTRTMQNHYKKILAEAGVSYKNFHTLRHTYATNCIESGVDVKALSEMLGHSDVQITLNYYVHPSMDTKRIYAERLCNFYVRTAEMELCSDGQLRPQGGT